MKRLLIKNLFLIFSFTLFAINFLPISCAKKTEYGQKVAVSTNSPQLKVKDVLASDQYVGKDVVMEGKITLECGSGCWFNLDDGTGKIYVDLLPSNIAIPQWVGKSVVVNGKVVKEDGDKKMVGTGVTLK